MLFTKAIAIGGNHSSPVHFDRKFIKIAFLWLLFVKYYNKFINFDVQTYTIYEFSHIEIVFNSIEKLFSYYNKFYNVLSNRKMVFILNKIDQ